MLLTALTDRGTVAFPGAVTRQYTVPGKLFAAVKATAIVAFCDEARTVTESILGMGGMMLMVGRDEGREVGKLVKLAKVGCVVGRQVG